MRAWAPARRRRRPARPARPAGPAGPADTGAGAGSPQRYLEWLCRGVETVSLGAQRAAKELAEGCSARGGGLEGCALHAELQFARVSQLAEAVLDESGGGRWPTASSTLSTPDPLLVPLSADRPAVDASLPTGAAALRLHAALCDALSSLTRGAMESSRRSRALSSALREEVQRASLRATAEWTASQAERKRAAAARLAEQQRASEESAAALSARHEEERRALLDRCEAAGARLAASEALLREREALWASEREKLRGGAAKAAAAAREEARLSLEASRKELEAASRAAARASEERLRSLAQQHRRHAQRLEAEAAALRSRLEALERSSAEERSSSAERERALHEAHQKELSRVRAEGASSLRALGARCAAAAANAERRMEGLRREADQRHEREVAELRRTVRELRGALRDALEGRSAGEERAFAAGREEAEAARAALLGSQRGAFERERERLLGELARLRAEGAAEQRAERTTWLVGLRESGSAEAEGDGSPRGRGAQAAEDASPQMPRETPPPHPMEPAGAEAREAATRLEYTALIDEDMERDEAAEAP